MFSSISAFLFDVDDNKNIIKVLYVSDETEDIKQNKKKTMFCVYYVYALRIVNERRRKRKKKNKVYVWNKVNLIILTP